MCWGAWPLGGTRIVDWPSARERVAITCNAQLSIRDGGQGRHTDAGLETTIGGTLAMATERLDTIKQRTGLEEEP